MASYLHLVEAARRAQQTAYAPYSKFSVGAALLGQDGRIFTGANVENASYGLTICAERNAVSAAVLANTRAFEAIAVATPTTPASPPCGMCLQTLAEFAEGSLILLLAGSAGEPHQTTLGELLPQAFRL